MTMLPALAWKSPVLSPPVVPRACIGHSMTDKAQYVKNKNFISIEALRNALAQMRLYNRRNICVPPDRAP
jgi:hypothetical protein